MWCRLAKRGLDHSLLQLLEHLILLISREYKGGQHTKNLPHTVWTQLIRHCRWNRKQAVLMKPPSTATLNPGMTIFFLHIVFMCGKTYTIFICVYGICFWHHSHLLSFGWSSLLSVSSSLDSLVPPQFPLFKAAPFDSELFCAWLRGFLCFFFFKMLQLLLLTLPLLLLTTCFKLSFSLLFFFPSTSTPSLAFVSLFLPPPASRLSLRGISENLH